MENSQRPPCDEVTGWGDSPAMPEPTDDCERALCQLLGLP